MPTTKPRLIATFRRVRRTLDRFDVRAPAPGLELRVPFDLRDLLAAPFMHPPNVVRILDPAGKFQFEWKRYSR